jgi:hypothetical protein
VAKKATGKATPAVDTTGLSEDDKILKIALERFRQIQAATSDYRNEALEDIAFVGGKQWVEQVLRDRTEDRRPALTINKTYSFVNRVVNDIRQAKPSIKVRGVDNLTDKDTAEVLDGLIRHILTNGSAPAAFNNSTFFQVACGSGFYRVLTDYVDDESFDQEIFISRIENPFSVYFPVHLIKEADYSDATHCFIRSRMSKDEFALKYPNSKTASFEGSARGDLNWVGEDYIYLAEYFNVEEKNITIYLLNDGSVVRDKKDIPEGAEIVKERETIDKEIKWYLINDAEILDRKDVAGDFIPIIPVLGQEIPSVDESGRKTYLSLVRFMKDPQRMYNFWMTAYTEKVANAPRAPYIAAAGQTEKFEEWKTLNSKTHSVLRYEPRDINGTVIGAPQRQHSAEVESGIMQGVQLASGELKEVTGIYDASLGSNGQETSGRAIIARQKQGDISNFHFSDNQTASYHLLGKILIGLIPEVYDTARAIRILGEDMTSKIVEVNTEHPGKDGKLYDLTVGRYDVIVDVGPSYETKRVEAAETLSNIMPQMPLVGQVAPDLIMRMLDNPLSEQVADRLKRFIQAQPNMQGVIAQDENGNSEQISQDQMRAVIGDLQKVQQAHMQTMQENQQMQGMIQNLQKALKDKSDAVAAKVHDTEVRAATQLAAAKIKQQTDAMHHGPVAARAVIENAALLHNIGQNQGGIPEQTNSTNAPAANAENVNANGVQ